MLKGAIAADRAFVHNDMARKLMKCRQIRQIGLLCPVIYNAVKKYIRATMQILLLCLQNHAQKCLMVTGDLREHKGSIAIYCKVEPLCMVKVDRCADRLIFRRLITFLMFRN